MVSLCQLFDLNAAATPFVIVILVVVVLVLVINSFLGNVMQMWLVIPIRSGSLWQRSPCIIIVDCQNHEYIFGFDYNLPDGFLDSRSNTLNILAIFKRALIEIQLCSK